MERERELQINPLVSESIMFNTKTLNSLNNLVASLLGFAAGILGLESYSGFIFYFVFTLLTSGLVWALKIRGGALKGADISSYFYQSHTLFTGSLADGLSGFILTWTLAYGLVRA